MSLGFVRAAIILSAALWALPAAAADLYVAPTGSDTNPGTAAAPFATIAQAASVVSGGTIVHVAPGTYPADHILITASGTASAPIRFVSDTKGAAKLIPPPTSSNEAVFDVRGNYVFVDGFEIDGTLRQAGTAWVYGIILYGSNDTAIRNLVHSIQNSPESSGCTHGAGGITTSAYYGGTHNDVIGNVVHDIGPAPTSCNLDHGIYIATSGNVQNNLSYHNSAWGIVTWHDATNVTIANNTVFNNLSGGIGIGAGPTYYLISAAAVDNFRVINNISYGNVNYGIGDASGATLGANSYYSNNNSFGNGTNWFHYAGGPNDPAPINSDPQFVNYIAGGGGDYHLKATSPDINSGTAVNVPFANDLDRNVRPQGTRYDVGAYEYVQIYTSGSRVSIPYVPTDVSGASLEFTPVNSRAIYDTALHECKLDVTFDTPSAISDTRRVQIGNIPSQCQSPAYWQFKLGQCGGTFAPMQATISWDRVDAISLTNMTGGPILNNQLAGQRITCNLSYSTATANP